ncbi:E3 ubiquitin ligase family protein [Sabulilitoribacter arenilitoris]|uniref:E3 ubiquitin ligase family protein n=1 Tax=Wocania arenilitoris TaxID=2044858 RepID=A0AAE3EKV3_9FLAO|nr:E3 ubiquitin ligase family protein [Wocania arenilitoris]MCF7567376.1 E3 ubiquitin ligase family protein [Wocania arenilitoris]
MSFKTDELTKVTGKVLHVHEPFVMPYSKRKCVAYLFKIERKVRTGKHSRWKTLIEKEDIQDFFIEKNGEVVIVKPRKSPKNYYGYLVEDTSISSGTFNDPTPEFKKVLDDFGIESENWFGFNKTLRYTERIIEVGEVITVGGVAKWKAIDKSVSGYENSKIATLESSGNQKIIITDLISARRTELQNFRIPISRY